MYMGANKILNFAWVSYTVLYEYNITNKYFITLWLYVQCSALVHEDDDGVKDDDDRDS